MGQLSPLRIDRIDVWYADAGWKTHGFVKVTTVGGLAGWGEFSPAFAGRTGATPDFGATDALVGRDVRAPDLVAELRSAHHRPWAEQQAFGAVANAVLDIRARALGVPVHELLGGAVRDRIPLYWAHCGTYRITHAGLIGQPALRSLDDLVRLGREVRARGFSALKANLLILTDGEPRRYKVRSGQPVVDAADPVVVSALREQLAALREGAGPDAEILLDIGAGFSVGAAMRLAEEAARFGVSWLEVEGIDAPSLSGLRARAGVPIATGERMRRGDAHAALAAGGTDVLITDVPFSGVSESLRIAQMAEAFDTLVAPHNCYSPLATMMSAAFAAVTPNLKLMEIDVDEVPWESAFVTVKPEIRDGYLMLPDGPGWGTEVDESAVLKHPAEQ